MCFICKSIFYFPFPFDIRLEKKKGRKLLPMVRFIPIDDGSRDVDFEHFNTYLKPLRHLVDERTIIIQLDFTLQYLDRILEFLQYEYENENGNSLTLPKPPIESTNLHKFLPEWYVQFIDHPVPFLKEFASAVLSIGMSKTSTLYNLICIKIASVYANKNAQELNDLGLLFDNPLALSNKTSTEKFEMQLCFYEHDSHSLDDISAFEKYYPVRQNFYTRSVY